MSGKEVDWVVLLAEGMVDILIVTIVFVFRKSQCTVKFWRNFYYQQEALAPPRGLPLPALTVYRKKFLLPSLIVYCYKKNSTPFLSYVGEKKKKEILKNYYIVLYFSCTIRIQNFYFTLYLSNYIRLTNNFTRYPL